MCPGDGRSVPCVHLLKGVSVTALQLGLPHTSSTRSLFMSVIFVDLGSALTAVTQTPLKLKYTQGKAAQPRRARPDTDSTVPQLPSSGHRPSVIGHTGVPRAAIRGLPVTEKCPHMYRRRRRSGRTASARGRPGRPLRRKRLRAALRLGAEERDSGERRQDALKGHPDRQAESGPCHATRPQSHQAQLELPHKTRQA